jgi:hypothetical protein
MIIGYGPSRAGVELNVQPRNEHEVLVVRLFLARAVVGGRATTQ